MTDVARDGTATGSADLLIVAQDTAKLPLAEPYEISGFNNENMPVGGVFLSPDHRCS